MAKASTILALFLVLYVTTAQHVKPSASSCTAGDYPTATTSALSPKPGQSGSAPPPPFLAEAPPAEDLDPQIPLLTAIFFSSLFVSSLAEAMITLGYFLGSLSQILYKVILFMVIYLVTSLKNVRSLFFFFSGYCLLIE